MTLSHLSRCEVSVVDRSAILMKPVTGAVTVPPRVAYGGDCTRSLLVEMTTSTALVVGYRFVSLANHRATSAASAVRASPGWYSPPAYADTANWSPVVTWIGCEYRYDWVPTAGPDTTATCVPAGAFGSASTTRTATPDRFAWNHCAGKEPGADSSKDGLPAASRFGPTPASAPSTSQDPRFSRQATRSPTARTVPLRYAADNVDPPALMVAWFAVKETTTPVRSCA